MNTSLKNIKINLKIITKMTEMKLYTTGMLSRMFGLKKITVKKRCSGKNGKARWGAEKINILNGMQIYVVPEDKLFLWKAGDGKKYMGRKPKL